MRGERLLEYAQSLREIAEQGDIGEDWLVNAFLKGMSSTIGATHRAKSRGGKFGEVETGDGAVRAVRVLTHDGQKGDGAAAARLHEEEKAERRVRLVDEEEVEPEATSGVNGTKEAGEAPGTADAGAERERVRAGVIRRLAGLMEVSVTLEADPDEETKSADQDSATEAEGATPESMQTAIDAEMNAGDVKVGKAMLIKACEAT
ncbi:hypothetical protein PR002_g28167 [Phytophthora rubi]|uniref:Uncharacterized protein n=1 Tax=Phytophthora rubi TaxID=129364 RepID=A0A6A3HDW4_9STRA|nr:hypothetical protein PR002_g28167 [Phytophthora rubi]